MALVTSDRIVPDMVIYNGKILTVDKKFSTAECVAVIDQKVAAIGGNELRRLSGKGTKEIDLKGRTVIPGLIDFHTHQCMAGLEAESMGVKVNILTLDSIEQIVKAVGEKVKSSRPGEWIVTSCMYRGSLKEGRFPTRYDLDPVSPNNPVYVMQSGKNVIVNSYALNLAGITKNTPSPTDPEGFIMKDLQRGEPTGHLIAGGGDLLRKRCLAKMGKAPIMWDFLIYDKETKIVALKKQMQIFNRAGVTGVRDLGVSADEVEAYQELWRSGGMTVRTSLVLGIPARYMEVSEIGDKLVKYFGPKQGFGDHMLRLDGLKMMIQNDGWWALSPEKVRAFIETANRNNWRLVMSITTGGGGEANDYVLDLLEEVDRDNPIKDRRFTIEHFYGTRDKDYYERLRNLGIIVATNPLLSYYAAARSMVMHDQMEEVRISKLVSKDAPGRADRDWGLHLKDWLDAGITVSCGSDVPAANLDPEHPLLGMYYVITGNSLAGAIAPGQNVTREQALRMYTINNAYGTFEEDVKGSIEAGKLADLVVLSDDITSAPEEKIKDIVAIMTIVDGKIVYER